MLALVRARGLPEPQTNVLIAGELVDFAWPEAKLIVEADGYFFHKSRAQFEADRRRDAKLQLLGYRILRITQRRLSQEPARVAEEIKALLASRPDLL
jgi:very-short-patch-repair endonuclease